MSAPKLTSMQVKEIREKRERGYTQKKLAEEYNVSPSLIQHYCATKRKYVRTFENPNIKYEGIRKWLSNNQITVARMARGIGMNYVALYYMLIGDNEPRKNSIDRILKYTGLTYEEAFAVNDD